jgi:hypothetical protein
MSAVTATLLDCVILAGPHDAGSTAKKHLRAVLYVTNGATQVAGGTDTLDVNVRTALQTFFRNSVLYTLRASMVYQTAMGTAEYAGTLSTSSNTISLNPESITNWTTDATIAASNLTRPYGIAVIVEVP